jgi:hypothetical protein
MVLDFITFINGNLTINAAAKQQMLSDFCSAYGYEANITDEAGNSIPNPVTKVDFANRKINNYIKEVINSYRKRKAQDVVSYDNFDIV